MRKLAFGAAVAAAVLFSSAIPASALTTTRSESSKLASLSVTDCPNDAAVGTTCRDFLVFYRETRSVSGAVTLEFTVEAGVATATGPGVFSYALDSAGVVTAARFSSPSGRTASLSFTVDLVCVAPGCAIQGPHRFRLSIRKGSASIYSRTSTTFEREDGACRFKQTSVLTTVNEPVTKGSVRAGNATKSLNSFTGLFENVLFLGSEKLVIRGPAGCSP
jgi:hypothetical protein